MSFTMVTSRTKQICQMNEKQSNEANQNVDDDHNSPENEQIRVSLVLVESVRDRTLRVPSEPLTVPASIGPSGLNALLNHLINGESSTDSIDDESSFQNQNESKRPKITFEFLVGPITQSRRLLRSGLEQEVRRIGLNLEESVTISYFPAQEVPQSEGQSECMPDWISAMTWSGSPSTVASDLSMLCAGSYDGSLSVLHPVRKENDINVEQIHFSQGHKFVFHHMDKSPVVHKGPIKCIDATIVAAASISTLWIASGSMDHTLAVHTFNESDKLRTRYLCVDGHSSSLGCVHLVHPKSDNENLLLASGDWEGGVCLWDIPTTENRDDGVNPATEDTAMEEEVPTVKKKKTGKLSLQKTGIQEKKLPMSPTISIRAHVGKVTGVSFGNHHELLNEKNQATSTISRLITGSWDHSLKLWDIDRQECLLTLNGSRVVSCLDTSFHSPYVVASGHPDCMIRLWDMRGNNTSLTVSDTTFRPSHKSWVSGVRWSCSNPYHLASTSHDGSIKLWDIRSSLPLHTIPSFPKNEKGLCLAYGQCSDGGTYLFAGGTDRIIKQFRLGPKVTYVM
jgi:ribosome biogenesis protein